MFAVVIVAVLLFALFLDKEYKRYCLESEVGYVADAESQNKGACFMDMRERPCADDNEMEEEGADSKSEEVLDECARVFVETFDYSVVLDSGNDGKVEWDEGHDCLEDALCEPQGAEGSQYEHDGQDDKAQTG